MILTQSRKVSFSPWQLLLGLSRYLIFFCLCLIFIVHHELVGLVLRQEKLRLHYYLKSISWHCRLALWLFNIKVTASSASDKKLPQGLLVCNHLSYIDVLVLFAYYPSLFVTSVEIRETFLLGRLTKLGGCFFVERRKARRTSTTIVSEMESMKAQLVEGHNVFLFPEGTSSDGQGVLPFKSTFFQLALDASVPVRPLVLRYQGEAAHTVPWYGDMGFPDHLLKVCLLSEIRVSLTELSTVTPVAGQDRFALAQFCHERIQEAYAKH